MGMGYPDIWPSDREYAGKVEVSRHKLERQGYDVSGRYFGIGDPLWHVTDADDEDLDAIYLDAVIRAPSREAAREMIRERFPRVRFGN